MTFETDMVDVASELIIEFGKTVTATTFSSEVYSPSAGTVSRTETETSIVISPPHPYNSKWLSDSLVQSGDFECITPSKDAVVTPHKGMTLLLETGETWTVVEVGRLYVGDSSAGWPLLLRR